MPTIDQLAPAVAASDADELMISQNGVSRKISRGLLLSGLQPQIALSANSLMGNPTVGTAQPTQIAVGANLTLAGGTLSATAAPYYVNSLPSGTVPAVSDAVPLGQSGTNTAVTYAQFMAGLPGVANVDGSNLQVKPTGSAATLKLSDLAADAALTTGAMMTGPLSLAADPGLAMQAATKQYVDNTSAAALPKSGGVLTGPLTLAANPVQPMHAATKLYVDGQASALLPTSGGTLSGALTLAADPAQPLQAATKQYVDSRVQRSGDTMSGPLGLAADPAQPLQAATKQYVDARVQRYGDTMTGALTLAADPAQPLHAATKQYVDARVLRSGDTMTGALTLAADPTQALHAATKEYVDAQASGRLSTGGGTVSGALNLAGSGQSNVQNGSLYIGNSEFRRVLLKTAGPDIAAFNKVGSATTDTSVVNSFYYVNHQGGTGHVINNLAVGTAVTSSPADGIWGLLSTLSSSSGGGNGGSTGHVAGYLQTVRSTVPIPSSTITANGSGTTVHVADVTNFFTGYAAGVGNPVSSANPLAVTIGGKPYGVVACTPDTPSANSGPGSLTLSTSLAPGDGVAGQSVVGQVTGANLWGSVIEYREQVDLPSSKSGYGQTLELDWFGNNLDDADTRCLISAVVGKNAVSGSDVEVGNLIGVWPGNGASTSSGASIKRGLQVNLSFSQAIIDVRNGTQKPGANAIWLADGQTVAFSRDGNWVMRYNAARPGFEFLFSGGVLGAIDTLSRYTAPGGFLSGGEFASNMTVAAGQAAFDARGATQNTGGNIVWLSDGHRIALSLDGTHTIGYDNASGTIQIAGAVKFSAPPLLPSYTVAALPTAPLAGAKAYASNGRKSGEAAGAGSGVEVFADGSSRWISILSGAPVQA